MIHNIYFPVWQVLSGVLVFFFFFFVFTIGFLLKTVNNINLYCILYYISLSFLYFLFLNMEFRNHEQYGTLIDSIRT